MGSILSDMGFSYRTRRGQALFEKLVRPTVERALSLDHIKSTVSVLHKFKMPTNQTVIIARWVARLAAIYALSDYFRSADCQESS